VVWTEKRDRVQPRPVLRLGSGSLSGLRRGVFDATSLDRRRERQLGQVDPVDDAWCRWCLSFGGRAASVLREPASQSPERQRLASRASYGGPVVASIAGYMILDHMLDP
jgi:hypothetical protein